MGVARGLFGLIFAGYMLLASQNPYPTIVYSVAKYRPHVSHFIIFAIPGRPRYEIRREQIHRLREASWFRWVDIARMLGMSPRTLTRRTKEFGMPLGQQHIYY